MLSVGCTTSSLKSPLMTNQRSFDQIKIGDKADFVKNNVGKPQSEYSGSSDEFSWYYQNNDAEKSLNATITFDKKLSRVQDILISPKENDNEINLDYLLHTKFKDLEFENFKKVTCKSSFYLNTEFYISKKSNLVIKYKVKRKFVEYYSYQNSKQIDDLITEFNKCTLKDF